MGVGALWAIGCTILAIIFFSSGGSDSSSIGFIMLAIGWFGAFLWGLIGSGLLRAFAWILTGE
jgi:hypothetical protein